MRHHHYLPLLLLLACLFNCSGPKTGEKGVVIPNEVEVAVNAAHFLEASLVTPVETVACTLSDGTKSTCYKIISRSSPTDHQMGPWCPDNISDGPESGGIWIEGGETYDVDGAFIKNMAAFYGDDTWKMYDAEGNIFTTDTKEDCANAANPNVGPEYRNFCVECLPSYVTDITQTYLIPTTPVAGENTNLFARGPGGGIGLRGIAFNGIRFDGPAPTNAILGAYTLAPFDDAGGHINLHAGYHYHAATGVSKRLPQPDGHAPMIGYAMDGYGLYANADESGNTAVDLDDCRGHYDEQRGYHYHVDKAGANNFINCLRGAYAK
ncbi:YHYH protein [Neolewinella persica]|uniref:YHYH protein n=1 Tax=Neolewinella persica TaxID=70998 RepID=UPI000A0455BE|nr:YHYH protein [Neolewinella persica]